MIDINELRRLAQAATPRVGHACKYQDAHWLREGHVDFENADLFIASERPQEDAEFYAAANPAVINELLDRLEAAEKERDVLHDRLALESQENGALHEAVDRACEERDALRARIEEMERQEPVEWQSRTRPVWNDGTWTQWSQCSKGYAEDIKKTPLLHDWLYETRALYTLPSAKGE